jgi:predicted ATPase/class 3 adenylate cyclase
VATRVERQTPSSARPSGTVTFLFSDIEGSTERWERSRDAMSAAVARHDVLMREALEARGGFVFKTIGDAFCAAFFTAPGAIDAALDAQRAIAGEDFSTVGGVHVRMALHTGAADERDGDYFGPAVNRVARLLAIGHGGQVLVSGTAADLLQGEMPPESSLRDLGAHRLKDLARPEQVYQVVARGLPETFPPLRSLDELPNNLPRQLTSFVGRDQVITDVAELIQKSALVTIVGAGGAGKTRCAIQIGAELLDGSADGVWHAELATISDPSLVSNVIAQAINVQGRPDRPTLETLLTYLKRKSLLLIFDNCEHVIDEARRVIAAILHDCPQVRVLATSREPLNISGEATYRMPSLTVPSNVASLFSEGVSRYEAVQLFVDRALFSNNSFAFTGENAPYVAEICRRLDGIPLAIELAAARVKVLSPKQLAQKLDERFRLLTGGDRSALPRQQTMRALIDWSYELLTDDERELFRKLSIFAGGFTLEAAAAVCSSHAIDEMAVLDLLSSLVDKSLVQAELVADGTRYRLLESTRDYARDKLTERGEDSATAQVHANTFLALAEKLDASYDSTPDRAWTMQSEPEMENWRAALEWSLNSRGDVALAQRLAASMRWMWYCFAASEGRRWVRAALATTDATTPDSVIGQLELAEAHLDSTLAQHKAARDAAQRALERLREFDDVGMVEAQRYVGRAAFYLGGGSEGDGVLREALESAERLGLQKLRAAIFADLATAQRGAGDLIAARRLFSEARALARSLGSERLMTTVAMNSGELEFQAGDAPLAATLAHEALAAARSLNNPRAAAIALTNLSAYLVALQSYDDARNYARDAVRLVLDVQAGVNTAFALQHLAAVALFSPKGNAEGKHDAAMRAARMLGYVDARITALEAMREYTEQQEYDNMMATLANAFADDERASLMAQGASWSEDQAVAEAMLI